ncbi:MAG: 3-phosphoshikimate 1-carboxyvinyltransferase [Dissulfurispiraceae bacterium]
MKNVELTRVGGLKGEVFPPPDKSISHRAVMLASIAEGESVVRNFLKAEDPISTIEAFKMLGIKIDEAGSGVLIIQGEGLYGLTEPTDVINCGNSGTTIRLMSGILSGNPFLSILTGDESLRQRPMERVILPLRKMGAVISGRNNDRFPPMSIKGQRLTALNYAMPLASAQLKSCLLLAALYACGATSLREPFKSRDHTERMLGAMGASISVDGLTVTMEGGSRLHPFDMTVPSDFSSAAFFLVAAIIVPNSEITIKGVGINPTRTGLLNVIRDMGACVELSDMREVSGEPVADMHCKSAKHLKAVKIGKEIVPSLIDEFPALCVLATQAEGVSEIRGAEDLRVKESDRIKSMASELKKLGVHLEEYPDGIAIKGKSALKGGVVESYGDHRIAMALSVAALISNEITTITNASCVDISFPHFFKALRELIRGA